jgi:hypothetical protein
LIAFEKLLPAIGRELIGEVWDRDAYMDKDEF